MDKQQLEEKIRAAAAEIFSLAETERHKGSEEFNSLKAKLATNIWNWCNTVFGKPKTGNAGGEIMECINRSLSSFKGSPAEYMKYIAVSLKNDIRRTKAKATDEEKHLIRLPDKKERKIKQFLHFAEQYGKDIRNTDTQQLIAKEFSCSVEDVSERVQCYFQSFVQGDTIVSDNGEELSLWEIVPAPENMTEDFDVKIELEHCLIEIDKAFASVQKRTKPYLSVLITHRLLVELETAKLDTDSSIALLCKKSFAKTAAAQKIIEAYKAGGDSCSQEDVAGRFRRDKTDASRTLKNFLEKVSTLMKSDYNTNI